MNPGCRSQFQIRLAAVCIFAGLFFMTHGPAYALPYVIGQVFASVGLDQVKVFTPDGALVQTLNTLEGVVDAAGFTTGSTFDAAGNFYVTNFSSNTVSKFDIVGTLLGQFGGPYSLSPESIVFDNAGNAYVGHADGDMDIRKFSAAGLPLFQYDVVVENRGSGWIDLAADQRTIFYTSEGRLVKRFDVLLNTQLADFTTLPGEGTAFDLRLLPDGGLLVVDTVNIKRLNSSGVVVQTYDVPGEDEFLPMDLDPDQITFWSGGRSSGEIYRFNIATGALVKSFNAQPPILLAGLSIFGGPPPIDGIIPEPSTIVLLMTGLGWLLLHKARLQIAAYSKHLP
jgi:DNA-binding beta-propeller fold protein YncE